MTENWLKEAADRVWAAAQKWDRPLPPDPASGGVEGGEMKRQYEAPAVVETMDFTPGPGLLQPAATVPEMLDDAEHAARWAWFCPDCEKRNADCGCVVVPVKAERG